MQLRHIRYFVAVARLRHFARAAEQCGVSQPSLSAGLVALEQELGVRLVERDRRFLALTAAGEAALPWAEQMLGAVQGLARAAMPAEAALTGVFALAVIPSALPLVGPFGEALLAAHPGLTLAVRTASARDIAAALVANTCDAALTYLDTEPGTARDFIAAPLGGERFLVLTHREAVAEGAADLTTLPLGLLDRTMHYRRLLDAHLAGQGIQLIPRIEADNHIALISLVQTGAYATILPEAYAGLIHGQAWARLTPLSAPSVSASAPTAGVPAIGLVVLRREPPGPLAMAALAAARHGAVDG